VKLGTQAAFKTADPAYKGGRMTMAKRIDIVVIIALAIFVLSVQPIFLIFAVNGSGASLMDRALPIAASATMLQPSERLLPIKQNGRWGYIDKNANIVIQPQYDEAHDFIGEIAPVKIHNKWGYIDRSGRVVLSPRSYDIWLFYDGLSRFSPTPTTWKYINQQGETVIRIKADFAQVFSEGFAAIRRGTLLGIY